jgi:hypothetical protein
VWRDITPILQKEGYRVLAPRLDKTKGLRDYVQQIKELAATLSNPAILGHSYGGMVISAIPDCSHRIYLDAPVPDAGASLFSIIGPENEKWFRLSS